MVVFLIGYFTAQVLERIEHSKTLSFVGGTMQSICRALEAYKADAGQYPDSISGLDASSFSSGDFSSEIATQVFYMKSKKGYVLAAGSPMAAIADESGRIKFITPYKPLIQGSGLTSH